MIAEDNLEGVEQQLSYVNVTSKFAEEVASIE